MTFNTEKFEALLEAKKIDEAKAMIAEMFAADLSEAEQGAVYTQLAVAKLKLDNAVNRRYKAVLENVVEGLRELKKASTEADDKINLMGVRGKLAK